MNHNTPDQASLLKGKLLTVVLSCFTAIGFGIGAGVASKLPQSNEVSNKVYSPLQEHTLEEYDLLEIGDSLRTVEHILGFAEKLNKNLSSYPAAQTWSMLLC